MRFLDPEKWETFCVAKKTYSSVTCSVRQKALFALHFVTRELRMTPSCRPMSSVQSLLVFSSRMIVYRGYTPEHESTGRFTSRMKIFSSQSFPKVSLSESPLSERDSILTSKDSCISESGGRVASNLEANWARSVWEIACGEETKGKACPACSKEIEGGVRTCGRREATQRLCLCLVLVNPEKWETFSVANKHTVR